MQYADFVLHVKHVSRIDIETMNQLQCNNNHHLQQWLRAQRWLLEPANYKAVPARTADGTPYAHLLPEHVQLLEQHGIVMPVHKCDVRGHVKMFLVAEPDKRRLRPIKHTLLANTYLGKETLQSCPLPLKYDITSAVNAGEYMLQVDFSSYFDQFQLSTDVGEMFCFRSGNKYYRLNTLAMGQRQAVEVAQTASRLLLDFPDKKSSKSMAYIDNVVFIGTREGVIADATTFVERVKSVGGQLNEDTTDLAALVRTSDVYGGIHMDLTNKTTRLADKTITKLKYSWARRESWTWRNFAAHIGLLMWANGIIDTDMCQHFTVLRFVSRVGSLMQSEDDKRWDDTAVVWPSVWAPLAAWTALVEQNKPRFVPVESEPEWLLEVDASSWGWGYIAVNTITGEVRTHGERWSFGFRRLHGYKLRRSTFTEPHGLHNSLCHLLSLDGPRSVRIATDSTVTRASFERGFNTHSVDINDVLKKTRAFFGGMFKFDVMHISGTTNNADGQSRGRGALAPAELAEAAESLRRKLGTGR